MAVTGKLTYVCGAVYEGRFEDEASREACMAAALETRCPRCQIREGTLRRETLRTLADEELAGLFLEGMLLDLAATALMESAITGKARMN